MQMLTCIFAEPNDIYLTHHWPICDSKLGDTVGGSLYDLKLKTNSIYTPTFTSDRFSNANSALALELAYASIPSGVFFDTPELTITVWVNPYFAWNILRFTITNSVYESARIIDFGIGAANSNIVLALDSTSSVSSPFNNPQACSAAYPTFIIYDGTSNKSSVTSNKPLSENKWHHLAATFNGITLNLYMNGTIVGTQSLNYLMPKSLMRSLNYVGKSNWAGDGYSLAHLDDLRFYNKSLNQMDIQAIMQETCKIEKLCL